MAMTMADTAIQVLDVIKRYGNRTILDAIRLDVFNGETLVILGGSGSGTSTLLRLMMGNIMPDGGLDSPMAVDAGPPRQQLRT